jgi:hypothetical protein
MDGGTPRLSFAHYSDFINAGIDFDEGEYSSEALVADLKLLETVLGSSIRHLEEV